MHNLKPFEYREALTDFDSLAIKPRVKLRVVNISTGAEELAAQMSLSPAAVICLPLIFCTFFFDDCGSLSFKSVSD
eukprot:scaffold2017_cov181-Ochromonas_danica.AAC.2